MKVIIAFVLASVLAINVANARKSLVCTDENHKLFRKLDNDDEGAERVRRYVHYHDVNDRVKKRRDVDEDEEGDRIRRDVDYDEGGDRERRDVDDDEGGDRKRRDADDDEGIDRKRRQADNDETADRKRRSIIDERYYVVSSANIKDMDILYFIAVIYGFSFAINSI